MRHLVFILSFLILSCGIVVGQKANPYQWTNISVQYHPYQKIKVQTNIQNRINLSTGAMAQRSIAVQGEYKINSFLNIGAHYRFCQFPNEYSEINQHKLANGNRWGACIEWNPLKMLKVKLPFQLVYRGQWQSESYLFLRNKNIFRQQLSIQPQLKGKKWQPSLDFEWFYRTNQNQYWIADDLIVTGGTREFRYQLNFDYKISDQQKLQIFALYRQFEIAKTNQIVFGIGYHFKINGPR